jgi:hypothetical protein
MKSRLKINRHSKRGGIRRHVIEIADKNNEKLAGSKSRVNGRKSRHAIQEKRSNFSRDREESPNHIPVHGRALPFLFISDEVRPRSEMIRHGTRPAIFSLTIALLFLISWSFIVLSTLVLNHPLAPLDP